MFLKTKWNRKLFKMEKESNKTNKRSIKPIPSANSSCHETWRQKSLSLIIHPYCQSKFACWTISFSSDCLQSWVIQFRLIEFLYLTSTTLHKPKDPRPHQSKSRLKGFPKISHASQVLIRTHHFAANLLKINNEEIHLSYRWLRTGQRRKVDYLK